MSADHNPAIIVSTDEETLVHDEIERVREYIKKSAELSEAINEELIENLGKRRLSLDEAHNIVEMAADYIKVAVELSSDLDEEDGLEHDALEDALEKISKANETIQHAEELIGGAG